MTDKNKIKKRLTDLPKGAEGIIAAITHKDEKTRKRLNVMGIYKGCKVVRKNNTYPILLQAGDVEIAIGKEFARDIIVETEQRVIFLLGNPNVGKSTLFSRITGVKTDVSNYPGTTVSLLNGEARFHNKIYTIYDMPGVYSMDEESKTEAEACNLLKTTSYDFAVYVADAMHLERNLYFALDVISLGKPTVVLLNKFDKAKKKGVNIDAAVLEEMLGVPVIPCSGLTGMGLQDLSKTLDDFVTGKKKYTKPNIPEQPEDKWKLIGQISANAQKIVHRHPSFLEKLEFWASTPLLGIPLALAVLILSFIFILNTGEFLIDFLTPLYEDYYLPFMQHIFAFTQNTFVWDILFGPEAGASEGFGILSEGIKIALIDVLSYVVVFYAVLEFLADLGYLPRLAILMDRVLHRVGLHGYSAIPIMLGFGCKVPALMSARSLETRRQRVIVFALILMMVPCISQTAMIFSIMAPHGLKYILLTFAIMLVVGLGIGYILNKILPGDTTDIFMEVPSWQLPRPKIFLKKIYARAKDYVVEAVPLIIAGIFIITVADMLGLVEVITNILRFPMTVLMGLPAETAPVVLLGFLRKDVSIALLSPFALTAKQLVIACVFMAMYMPCVASFFVLLKEGGWKDTLFIISITLTASLVTGALLNLIL